MGNYQLSFRVWIPLQLAALVGLVFIQLTAFLGRLTRGRVWYSFMASLVIFCISNCLLYIGGQQPANPQQEPNQILCVAQAALVYSDSTLVTLASSRNKMVLEQCARSPLLLALPYVLWCILIIIYLTNQNFPSNSFLGQFSITNSGHVKVSLVTPYCTLSSEPVPRISSYVACVISLAATMVLLVMIAIQIICVNKISVPSPIPREHMILFIRFTILWITSLISVVIFCWYGWWLLAEFWEGFKT
ncbi:hypothetical protein L218DRAFT_1058289 [Marasmius fiardii PR-910]|nr:hypothetical protein L218DRAFT_1058289 [Marasmius fiardii PR-910]